MAITSLTYTDFNLSSIKEDGTLLRGPFVAYPVSGSVGFAMGELVRATIEVTASTQYSAGDVLVFNAALFNQIPRYLLPSQGEGWRLQVVGSAGSYTILASPIGPLNQVNFRISGSIDATNTVLTLLFDFYMLADVDGWLGVSSSGVGIFDNDSALQKDQTNSPIFAESKVGRSVYGLATKYLETSLYLADASLLATVTALDPTNGNAPTYAAKLKGKWYDRYYQSQQSVSGAGYAYENLVSFVVQDQTGTTTCFYGQNGNVNDQLDSNFSLLSAPTKGVVNTGVSDVALVLDLPNAGPVTNVFLRLFRVGAANSSTFDQDVFLDSVELPASDLTPSPNWLASTFNTFGTPAGWSKVGTTLIANFKLDGSKIVLGAQYRLVVFTTTADDFFSTHMTPVFSGIQGFFLIGSIVGRIQTYNFEYLGDDLTVSPYEPYRCLIDVDASSFGGGLAQFQAGILTVSAQLVNDSGLPFAAPQQAGVYSFSTGQSSGTSPVSLGISGSVYTFQADFKAFPNINLTGSVATKVVWSININNAPVNQPSNIVTYTYEQKITIRPLDTTRLPQIRFLDVDTGNPVSMVCRDVDEVLVEVTKNGPPDANLIAVAHNPSGLQYLSNEGDVFLEASYSSPYLQQLSANLLSNVETSFGDNIAFYRLKISQIPSGLTFGLGPRFVAGALVYEPPLGLFDPSDLGADLLVWLNSDSLAGAKVWIDNGENVTLTNGATSFSFVPSAARAYLQGMEVSFDAGVSFYTITSVAGSTANLDNPISETSGVYDVFVASIQTWPDSSSYARTVQAPLALSPYYRKNQLAGLDSAYMLAPHYWSINPITSTDPQTLYIIGLTRIDALRVGTFQIYFAHRSSANALLQCYDIPSCLFQVRSAAGGVVLNPSTASNVAIPPNFNMTTFGFEQNFSGATELAYCWNNGSEGTRAQGTITGTTYGSSLQIIGNFFNGSSYFASYAGDFEHLFICQNLALADIQKLEGWLAWKYGIQAQLPLSHPYRNAQP